MQRRAVAVYVAFFLLVGTASYALIATADTPEITFDDPEHELEEGDEFEIDGQTYAVTSLERQEEEDHGQVEVTYAGEIAWEERQERTEQWNQGDVVTIDDTDWEVEIEDGTVTLHEQQDREAILEDDPDVANETVEADGEEYAVTRDDDGNATLVPAEEYFPEPREEQLEEGDTFEYQGEEALVDEVANESATVVWEADVEETRSLDHQRNVTLQGEDYMVFFQSADVVVLDDDHNAYQAQLAEIDTFEQHVTGLRRIAIVSGLVVVLLGSLAFLPSRY